MKFAFIGYPKINIWMRNLTDKLLGFLSSFLFKVRIIVWSVEHWTVTHQISMVRFVNTTADYTKGAFFGWIFYAWANFFRYFYFAGCWLTYWRWLKPIVRLYKNKPWANNTILTYTLPCRNKKVSPILAGIEPAIFCSVGRRVIHCATGPVVIPLIKN